MDDTCAVCAESLEWVAYGQCGHREVCSTCIARLRFICEDHRCCICKSESNVIFVTKGLGDYTRMINDFSIFPVDPRGGRIGAYWYHEETQAFFDDLDHFKMIVSMCKLSCIVCKEKDEQGSEGSKRRSKFRNIEQLKSHLFHLHSLLMCSLCLEGRKIFISEQKLYTRSQLNQHIKIGDLEVDGSVSERGGFMGHPMCEFCRNPFYGDNELYSHMSTEHYTCHMCQRQRPGQYDYFRDYDDLEVHFRREHFLCEDEACLAKKFMVFATELEMKRHNNMEHGGRMSRSKRNAALRIPISFQYQRSREQDQRGRGHGSHPDYSDSQLSLAIRASLETANADTHRATSSRAQADSDHRETSEIGSFSGSFETLVNEDSEPSSRYRQAVGANASLEESSFPPLPVTAKCSKRRNHSGGLDRNTMAAHLRRRNHVTVLHSSQALPAASHQQPTSQIGGSSQLRPMSNKGRVLSSGSASSSIGEAATVNGLDQAKLLSSMNNGLTTADAIPASSVGSSTKKISKKVSHSNFAAVSATHSNELRTNTPPLPEVVDVQTANTSLVERIRADLEFDEDKYAAFKVISSEYRQGIIDTGEYLAYVHQFGLSHLILELARLCPDALKQKELIEACSSSLRSKVHVVDNGVKLKHQKTSKKGKEKCDDNGISSLNGDLAESITNSVAELRLNSWPSEEVQVLPKAKGKEKCDDNGISSSDGALAESIMNSVAELRRNYQPSKEVQVLSKDGYRASNGKSMYLVHDEQADLSSGAQPSHGPRVKNHSQSVTDGSKKTSVTRGEGGKPRKKTSKFLRVRLGESSAAAVLDLAHSDPGPDLTEGQSGPKTNPSKALPVRGAWQNGGGCKLVANWQ